MFTVQEIPVPWRGVRTVPEPFGGKFFIMLLTENFVSRIVTEDFEIGMYCNGNTADSGSAFRGSNPFIPVITVPSSNG